MAETTYVLGAGINRGVKGPDGLLVPLARDFFRQALRHPRLSRVITHKHIVPLFQYIKKYWHVDIEDLKENDFDLEECFTLIELQRREASALGDHDTEVHTSRLEFLLTQLLLDYVSECEHWYLQCDEFQQFGGLIFNERVTVLSFNYDSLLEGAIERASPSKLKDAAHLVSRQPDHDVVRDEDIAYAPHEWDSYLAYNVRFDEVALRTPGPIRVVEGPQYYDHLAHQNKPSAFLKLHGSLGWFIYSGYRVDGVELTGEGASRAGRTVLRRGPQRLGLPNVDYVVPEVLIPLILTPVLNKPYEQHEVLLKIWARARDELRTCKKLMIGGYSFPPTDFHVRRLFRESFVERSPEELIIINPDTAVVSLAKELCNYKRPVVVCRDLGEFLQRGV